MKFVQSFWSYPVTYSSCGVTIPAVDADGELRNIVAVEDDKIAVLENKEPYFRKLVDQKKYRVLNHLPESYKASSVLVNEANERAKKAEAELAEMKAKTESTEEDPAAKKAESKGKKK